MNCRDLFRRVRGLGGGIALSGGLLIAGAAQGQALSDYQLYGIKGATNELYRHDFAGGAGGTVGLIQSSGGQVYEDVQATAYIPGHSSLLGFWKDPVDGLSKLLYIDMNTGRSAVVGSSNLGAGRITGAVAAMPTASTTGLGERTSVDEVRQHALYAVQQSVMLGGTINLNPNNSANNEFVLKKPDGSLITRENLKNATRMEFYTGPAVYMRVCPKGNGSQNSVKVEGATYTISNDQTYELEGALNVRVYNTSSNLSMGSWYVDVTSSGLQIDDLGGAQTILARLMKVDHKTGKFTTLMTLKRDYESLAAVIGGKFLATFGSELYELDPGAKTETLLGAMPTAVQALEFAGDVAWGFEDTANELQPLWQHGVGPAAGSPLVTGATGLRSIVFVRVPDAPRFTPYD